MKRSVVRIRIPSRESAVAFFSAGIGMSASFYSPPVISSSQHQSINTIKGPLYCGWLLGKGRPLPIYWLVAPYRKKFRLGLIPTEKTIVDDTALLLGYLLA